MLAIRPVDSSRGKVLQHNARTAWVGLRLIGVAPCSDGIPAEKGEVTVRDRRVAVEAGDHHAIAIQPLECAAIEGGADGAL